MKVMTFEVNKLQPARIASLSLHREGWPDPGQVTGYCLPSCWPVKFEKELSTFPNPQLYFARVRKRCALLDS
ncbi:hypothetical protein E2C01_085729 [Portunus trituberculatus]|uniref:Uncharacterized protein n=1 Tax=Portunus trituberculatus TaxID=210409 RepID=A0A5B7J3I4_PORTR|nr:hypothetical protein [Portunus trituberculatus]